MGLQLNGQDIGPIKFTDDKPGKTIHVGPSTPLNPVDGDVWIDSDQLNNAGKNLLQTIDLSTGGSSKNLTVSTDYKDLCVVVRGLNISANATLFFRVNNDTTHYIDGSNTTTTELFNISSIKSGVSTNNLQFNVYDIRDTTSYTWGKVEGVYTPSVTNFPAITYAYGAYVQTTSITSATISIGAATFVSGTILVYGVN
jgi:hypothetical protein